jgi:hypothetical protein
LRHQDHIRLLNDMSATINTLRMAMGDDAPAHPRGESLLSYVSEEPVADMFKEGSCLLPACLPACLPAWLRA